MGQSVSTEINQNGCRTQMYNIHARQDAVVYKKYYKTANNANTITVNTDSTKSQHEGDCLIVGCGGVPSRSS